MTEHQYEKSGVLDLGDIPMPPSERTEQGPVAILECIQHIPCDPCVKACPRGAITIKGNITDLPTLDDNKCNGCGLCVSICPGLAIFVVDRSGEEEDFVTLPYEFLPLPEVGDVADALDREGKRVGAARVVRVLSGAKQDRTAVITVRVPKGLGMIVRNIRC